MLITHMQVFALYAALNAFIIFALVLLVVRARQRHKVLIGDGGNAELLRAQRAHGNAIEYVPLILILLLTLASLKASLILIHVIGGLLTFGRILHAIGLSRSSGVSIGRAGGSLLTWIAMLIAIVACLFYALGL